MAIKPHYEEPYIAYAMRLFMWRKYVARNQNNVTDDDIQSVINQVLSEFGGIDRSGPTIYNYVKAIRKELDLCHKFWDGDEWYLLYAPHHQDIRDLSQNPVVHGPYYSSYEITLRDPSVPSLKITIGNGIPDSSLFSENPRVIYILRMDDDNSEKMYIGITNEQERRMEQHIKSKKPHWWFIAQPLVSTSFDVNIQQPTETMLIALWNEIAIVGNSNLSHQTIPLSPPIQQQATLLTKAISSTYVWLIREELELRKRLQIKVGQWEIPLKSWHGANFNGHYVGHRD